MEYVTLNNGVNCPVVGIGTFMLTPADAENSVREALKMGYSLVDTANAYVNERACGRGIKNSGMKREDVFLSTKLWPSEYENDNAVDETLERIGVDYVDLLYIHQPAGNWLAGYRQLEKAYKEGKAKAIGISNFEGKYIEELQTKWEIVPQFIQVEAHPYFTQKELRQVLDKYDIKLMSWYPLGHGDKSLINESLFAELGRKYGKSSAQVILRWHTQMGFVVIPGSKKMWITSRTIWIYWISLSRRKKWQKSPNWIKNRDIIIVPMSSSFSLPDGDLPSNRNKNSVFILILLTIIL